MSYKVYPKKIDRGSNKKLKYIQDEGPRSGNYASLALVINNIDNLWVTVKIIPSISYRTYDMKLGYKSVYDKNAVVKAIKPFGMTLMKDDLVLVTFTDRDSRKTLSDIIKGKSKASEFREENIEINNINFGIVTTKIL